MIQATCTDDETISQINRRFSRYSDAAISTIPFVERIPSHWRIQKLKYIANVRFSSVDKKTEEGETTVRLCNYTDVYNNDNIVDDPAFMQATATDAEIDRFTLRKGDVLITKDSEAWNDIAVPAYVTTDMPGVLCGYHLAHIRPNPNVLDGAFLSRAFSADGIRQQFHVAANGVTRYGLPNRAIAGGLFPVPPLDEQRAIAAFLNRETTTIDELIAKNLRLIDLLVEKRSSLASQAVTNGLNSTVSFKNSDVHWMGDIPIHWNVVRLRFLCDITTGGRDTQDADDTGEYPFFVRSDTIERISTWSFDGEGVLTSGDGVGVGKVFHHYTGKMEIHQRVYLFHNFRKIIGRYFFHFLRENLYKVVLEGGAKSTVDSLRRPMLQNFEIALPPLDEQAGIVELIDAEHAKLSALKSSIASAVEQLHIYRSALISAAVTGQIDVRNHRPEAPCR